MDKNEAFSAGAPCLWGGSDQTDGYSAIFSKTAHAASKIINNNNNNNCTGGKRLFCKNCLPPRKGPLPGTGVFKNTF